MSTGLHLKALIEKIDFSSFYFWTNPSWHLFLLSIVVILVCFWGRRLFGKGLLFVLLNAFSKGGIKISNTVLADVKPAFSFAAPALSFYIASGIAPWSSNVFDALMMIGKTVFILFVFSILYVFASHLEIFLERWEKTFSKAMRVWFEKVLEVIVILLGVVSVLEAWGIAVAPLVASFGLFGVAVALGAQDLFKNIIAGILVISEKRFNPGDWIRVSGVVEGTVEDIGFRSTLIRQFDKAPVYVPNTKFSDNPVVNFSRMTHRRIFWKIGVEYGATLEQLKSIRDQIETYILTSDDFVSPEEASTFVRIDRFNSSSIDIMLYCFTKTTQWGDWLKIKEDLAYHIKEIVEKSGTGFAFPSQTVYLDFVGDKPETFSPPKHKTI